MGTRKSSGLNNCKGVKKMTSMLAATDVLKRYRDEQLPEFSEIPLEDVNQVGNFGNSPLHIACVRGSLPEVQALLEAGADVNAAGELSNTPLHEAAGQGHIEVVRLLLAAGASPLEPNEFGETALDIATKKRYDDVAELIRHASS